MLVEPGGIEPPTSCMPCKRSPSRAMAPSETTRLGRRAAYNDPEHSSGPISSLLVAADIADDVGHILIAFFFVGDEGGVVVVIVLDRLVDFDVVLGFWNDRLDLAGVLLGIGLLERHQLLSLHRLRRCFGCCCRCGAGTRSITANRSRRRHRRDRDDLARIGRYHRALVEVVKFLTRRRANTFGSEIGFGHVWNPGSLWKIGASLG